MIKKTLHIALAILILFSSSGLIINKHYCLDQLVSVALMTDAEKCHIPTEKVQEKPESRQETLQKEDCCKDTSSFLKVNQEQKAENTLVNLFELNSAYTAYLGQKQFTDFATEVSLFAYQYYKPPLMVWDRSVHFQIFLC